MWKFKVLIQFLLASMPGGEKVNYILQKNNKSYSLETTSHRIPPLINILKIINSYTPIEGCNVVEIGTGWQPICSVLLYLMGAKSCHTFDHVRHVRFGLVQMLINSIEDNINDIAQSTLIPLHTLKDRLLAIRELKDLDEFFHKSNIFYHAPGDATNTGLPDHSVDLVFSYAVLEHVSEKTIYDITIESKRILKKQSGISFHKIGLFDHYTTFDKGITKVNFLKYPEGLWSLFVKNKISYHNRFREKHYLNIFESCGAKIKWIDHKIDPADLTTLKNIKIDKMFHGMSHEELAIYETSIITSFTT